MNDESKVADKITEFCEKVTSIHDAELQVVCAAIQYIHLLDKRYIKEDNLEEITHDDEMQLDKSHDKLIEAVHHICECIEQFSSTSSASEEYPK